MSSSSVGERMIEAYIWQFELFSFLFVISISPNLPHALTVEGLLWNQPDHTPSPSLYDHGTSLQLPLSSPSHCIELSPLNSTCHLLSIPHSILHSHKSFHLACLSYIYACLLKFCGHPEWHRVVPKFTTAVLPQLFVNVYVDLWFGLLMCVMTSNNCCYIQHCPTLSYSPNKCSSNVGLLQLLTLWWPTYDVTLLNLNRGSVDRCLGTYWKVVYVSSHCMNIPINVMCVCVCEWVTCSYLVNHSQFTNTMAEWQSFYCQYTGQTSLSVSQHTT